MCDLVKVFLPRDGTNDGWAVYIRVMIVSAEIGQADELTSRDEFEAELRLILLAGAGEPTAWEELVQEHQESVFRLAYLGRALSPILRAAGADGARARDRFDRYE